MVLGYIASVFGYIASVFGYIASVFGYVASVERKNILAIFVRTTLWTFLVWRHQ